MTVKLWQRKQRNGGWERRRAGRKRRIKHVGSGAPRMYMQSGVGGGQS